MSFYKFEQNDIFNNRLKTHPRVHFLISNKKTFYNKEILAQNTFDAENTVIHVPQGNISLYEMNVNRDDSAHDPTNDNPSLIHPFITKQGSLTSFKTVSTETFQTFDYGQKINGSYPLSSSIDVKYFSTSVPERRKIKALKNVFNFYQGLSPHYSYKSDNATGTWDKSTQDIKLISIPSIFYGSSIKKGSVKMNFYVTGSLVGTLEDKNRNGELIQTLPNDANAGKVAGVVLYNEGFVSVTGSWDIIDTYTDEFLLHETNIAPQWSFWGNKEFIGTPLGEETFCPSASWSLECKGTNYVPVMTMLAHAPEGELNHSNNPTFIKFGQQDASVVEGNCTFEQQNNEFIQNKKKEITNVVKSFYPNTSGSFEKVTYISKIGIYDEDKNLIAVAKLATPVKKTESRAYTFKMKMDF